MIFTKCNQYHCTQIHFYMKHIYIFVIIGCSLFSCKRKKELLNTGDAKIAGVEDNTTIKAPCSLAPKTFSLKLGAGGTENGFFSGTMSGSYNSTTGKYSIYGSSLFHTFSLTLSGKAQNIPTTVKFEENSKESFYIDALTIKPSSGDSYTIDYSNAATSSVLLYINKDTKSVRYEICDLPVKRYDYWGWNLEYATFSTNFTVEN